MVKRSRHDGGHTTETGDVAPARRTQASRTAATRSALLAAGRELFAQHGYAGASREEIVARAGVTRGAMYHHFESKLALFQAVYELVEEELMQSIVAAAMTSPDPVEQLTRGSVAFLRAAAQPDVARIALLDAPAVLPAAVRADMRERFGLGAVREALQSIDAAGRLLVGPIEPLASATMAALHESATAIAEGAAIDDHLELISGIFSHITRPAAPAPIEDNSGPG